MDRLYTNISVANWLLERKMTVVGTLMTNRIGIPEELKYINDREIFSSTIRWETKYRDIALCSYAVKTKSMGKKVFYYYQQCVHIME